MHGNAVRKTNLHFLGFVFVGGFLFVWVCHITWRNTETVLKWNSFCFRKGVRSPKQTLMGYPKQSRGGNTSFYGYSTWTVTKTLTICCISGITLPKLQYIYTTRHYNNPIMNRSFDGILGFLFTLPKCLTVFRQLSFRVSPDAKDINFKDLRVFLGRDLLARRCFLLN